MNRPGLVVNLVDATLLDLQRRQKKKFEMDAAPAIRRCIKSAIGAKNNQCAAHKSGAVKSVSPSCWGCDEIRNFTPSLNPKHHRATYVYILWILSPSKLSLISLI